ncbi:MAG TPA: hypothetical protein VG122_14545 [Gemmata sp.]|jgi:hypothetical protein|nr:hypothetical protein [Gemmata sp.]
MLLRISDANNTSSNGAFSDPPGTIITPAMVASGSAFDLVFQWNLSSGDGDKLFDLTPPPDQITPALSFNITCTFDSGQSILSVQLVDRINNVFVTFAELDGFSASNGASGSGVLTRVNQIGAAITWSLN